MYLFDDNFITLNSVAKFCLIKIATPPKVLPTSRLLEMASFIAEVAKQTNLGNMLFSSVILKGAS